MSFRRRRRLSRLAGSPHHPADRCLVEHAIRIGRPVASSLDCQGAGQGLGRVEKRRQSQASGGEVTATLDRLVVSRYAKAIIRTADAQRICRWPICPCAAPHQPNSLKGRIRSARASAIAARPAPPCWPRTVMARLFIPTWHLTRWSFPNELSKYRLSPEFAPRTASRLSRLAPARRWKAMSRRRMVAFRSI